jgi:putative PIN family toxin of toxin-antitoxin system
LGQATALTETAAARHRAVFDTNVVVTALIFGSRLHWVRHAWSSGAVIPIVCHETAAELVRVLAYPKFRLNAVERETILGDHLPFAEVAYLPNELPTLPIPCRDRDDAVFLHLMIASRADFVVSGDHDLAVLAAALPFMSPAELRLRLEQPRPPAE